MKKQEDLLLIKVAENSWPGMGPQLAGDKQYAHRQSNSNGRNSTLHLFCDGTDGFGTF